MIKCKICNKEMIYINKKHLEKHNITTLEYKKLFPNVCMVDKSKSIKNQFYNNHYWNDERISKLKTMYEWCSKEEILKEFPEKNWNCIYRIACQLKLKRRYRHYSHNHFIVTINNINFNAHKEKKNGYIVISNSMLKISNMRMHRYVWELYNGKIPKKYDIHHIDGNVENNNIENLELIYNVKHKQIERDLYIQVIDFLKEKNLYEEYKKWRENNENKKN